MRLIKVSILMLVLLAIVPIFQTKADANGGFSFGAGYYPRNYGYYPYYRGFYRPYWAHRPYWGGFYPYGYGFGYGYGYGYPAYGYYGGYGGYGGYYGPYSYYGDVRAEVKPKEAKVYVDGAYVGNVDSYDGWWQRLQLPPGKHRIVFRTAGYVPYAVTIRVLPGQDVKIKQQMQPGEDVINERDMQLDESERDQDQGYNGYGNPQDQGPNQGYGNERPVPPQRDSYDPYGWEKDRHSSQPPNDVAIEQDSNRITLVLKIVPNDATVYIDENYYGTADLNSSGQVQVLLPQGTHKIEIVRPGYESFTKEVQVDSQSQNTLDIVLQKK
jgi:hypothetical protein